uniref:Fatty acid-binding protein, muscle n=1 Tax=Tabanus bromius TaxID=304241 RepID=A0A0K8TL91_TABBR
MACWEGKKYKLDKSENFDEYMKALGVGLVLRKMGNTVSPTVELLKEGDSYSLTTSSTFKTTNIKFTPGEEFEEETVDGRKVKSVCTFENENKLVHEQKGEKPTTIIREFTPTELVATMTVGDIKCTRWYKAN